MSKQFILGTAGHIDHGKSSLIRALTGIDPDRLPEEKQRGITIELGYAFLDLDDIHLGIVDVPGHEKFIRQMLAGATGMDLVMLVVAADDSIKQQTREHMDILRLLEIHEGIIALTKIDLVEPDWLDLVETEVRELTQGTFLEDAEIIRVSSKTGAGLDDLRQGLFRAACRVDATRRAAENGPFRMAIDRSFTMEGFGAVVTGSVSSGSVSVGDVVELQPAQIEVRVRGLQTRDTPVPKVSRGQRAAVNVSGLRHSEIPRGNELASVGYLRTTKQAAVDLLVLPSMERPLKDRTRIRFHIGTAAVPGVIRFPKDNPELQPGQRRMAMVYLNGPIVATWGQPFVIRLESPLRTLGGGRIAFPAHLATNRPTPRDWQYLEQAMSNDPQLRISAAAYLAAFSLWQVADVMRWTGIAEAAAVIDALIAEGTIVRIPLSKERTWLLHAERMSEIRDWIVAQLRKLHQEFPLRLGHVVSEVQSRLHFIPEPELFHRALEGLLADKIVRKVGNLVALEGFGPKLSRGETQLYFELIEKIRGVGLKVDSPKSLAAEVSKNRDSVPQLLKLAVDSGILIAISDDWIIHRDTLAAVQERLREAFREQSTLTVSDIRTLLDVSRKYAVPLCEYLDKVNFTIRNGDFRTLAGAGTSETY